MLEAMENPGKVRMFWPWWKRVMLFWKKLESSALGNGVALAGTAAIRAVYQEDTLGGIASGMTP